MAHCVYIVSPLTRETIFIFRYSGPLYSDYKDRNSTSIWNTNQCNDNLQRIEVDLKLNHRKKLSRYTNKMQPCNRIYYSKIYWRLNMFRAAHRSSSEAPKCICSLWFIYPCGDRSLPRLSLGNGRSPHGYINQRLQIQFGAPDDERYAARNMLSLQ